jgi:hypothetical protein
VKRCALVLGAAACVTRPPPYPVLAEAPLEGSGIAGAIEVIGTTTDGGNASPYIDRTVAAYRVKLPDAAPRRVRIYDDPSCDAPRDTLRLRADLQDIRRVGDEAHFFARDVDIHGTRYAIDTETIQAPISVLDDTDNNVVGKIVVLSAPDGVDGAPGAWLACGVFVRAAAH